MNYETCTNPECGKKFSYSIIGADVPGHKESEEMRCPYCQHVVARSRMSGMYKTRKLEDDEE